MSSANLCYSCGKATPLLCMTPGCGHYFCTDHGDFVCSDCRQKQGQRQTQVVQQTTQRTATRNAIAGGILAVLAAILIGAVQAFFIIIKEILRGL